MEYAITSLLLILLTSTNIRTFYYNYDPIAIKMTTARTNIKLVQNKMLFPVEL